MSARKAVAITLMFAYGSNLHGAQMRERCPRARFLGPATLRGHRLAFVGWSARWGGGVATIQPERDMTVEGAVWSLASADLARLDSCEGVPHSYERTTAQVRMADGRTASVHAYRARARSLTVPSSRYFQKIQTAYAVLGFDVLPLESALQDSVAAARAVKT